MAKTRTIEGKTPSGGVKAIIYFLNDKNELVDQEEATHVDITEMDEDDNIINTVYAKTGRGNRKEESP
jgi:hypothetical protein